MTPGSSGPSSRPCPAVRRRHPSPPRAQWRGMAALVRSRRYVGRAWRAAQNSNPSARNWPRSEPTCACCARSMRSITRTGKRGSASHARQVATSRRLTDATQRAPEVVRLLRLGQRRRARCRGAVGHVGRLVRLLQRERSKQVLGSLVVCAEVEACAANGSAIVARGAADKRDSQATERL